MEVNEQNREIKGIKLERVSTKGLTALVKIGIAGLPFAAAILVAHNADRSFEYDNSSSKTLSQQYEEEKNVDIPDEYEELINSLSAYEKAADDYEAIQGIEGIDPLIELETRRNLRDSADELVDVSVDIIKEKIKESLKLSDSAVIDIKSAFNSADGVNHVIIVTDGDESYTVDASKLPSIYRKQLDRLYEESRYQGDGTGPKWENQMAAYAEELDGIYYGSLAISSEGAPSIKR